MGAYFILFPGGRIRTLWFIGFVPTWPKLRAFWFVLYYLVIQIPPAVNSYINGVEYGVGYWAHLGGLRLHFYPPIFKTGGLRTLYE